MTPWAIALVAPNSERRVSNLLTRFQYPHHVFWERLRVVHRGRLTERRRPLFSRYAFIKPEHIFDICRMVSDVHRAISFGEDLATVSDDTVQRLINISDGDVLPYIEPSARFKAGTLIAVTSGAMYGTRGLYHKALRNGRSLILIDWLGQMVPTEVDENDLEEYAEAVKQKRLNGRRRRQRHKRHAVHRNRVQH